MKNPDSSEAKLALEISSHLIAYCQERCVNVFGGEPIEELLALFAAKNFYLGKMAVRTYFS